MTMINLIILGILKIDLTTAPDYMNMYITLTVE